MAAGQDRDKALDLALSQIEKQFGKGSVMRLGERPQVQMAVIPTGSIALDVALGIGGLPRGRIVEIFGPESSGKCLTGDTYLWTDRGLETVAELFARCGQETACVSRVTDITRLGLRMVNERAELEPVAALTHNNRRPVLTVTLRSGRTINATRNHPLRVMTERGHIAWRPVGQIQPGDVLVSARFGAAEAASGDGLSEDEAVLLGYLVTGGSPTEWESEARDERDTLVREVLGGVAGRASAYGVDVAHAAVPYRVRTAGFKAQQAFLSALFEGDGWIDPSATVGLGTASEQLARDVQLLLYGLGIPASIYSRWNDTRKRPYWTVAVNPASAFRFVDEIGFRSARRRAQSDTFLRGSHHAAQVENIPHLHGLIRDLRDDCGGDREFDRIAGDLLRSESAIACSRARLLRIVEWAEARWERLSLSGQALLVHLTSLAQGEYTYEDVVSVEDGGLAPTFDVMLPRTHSFLANGVLSHNTTVALHAVASAQAAGGIAAFIDAEHALDPDYAKALGVDTDALLVSQPDTGEQALEIADMLVRSGALDILVIDSVAALVPRAEIEGEMGDSHVGLQARLMSQALRKITGALSVSGTTAVFINQLREKIGVMFGCASKYTNVLLADGTSMKIGEIVDQKLPVEVLSYDPELDQIVPKRVVNWFNNGTTDEFLEFRVERAGGGTGHGVARLAFTRNHLIRTPSGWREAEEIAVGDRVMLAQPHLLGPQQWQVILGAVMGDGNLSPAVRRDQDCARFRMGHGAKQAGYVLWKTAQLANITHHTRANAKYAIFTDFTPLAELNELRRAVYLGDGKKHLSWDYLKALTPLALAVWYMDDGGFTVRSKGVQERTRGGSGRIEICVEAMSAGTRERLVSYLRDTHGLDVKLIIKGKRKMHSIQFTTPATAKFQELVAPYVHPSMEYKLLPRFRGQFIVEPEFVEPALHLTPAWVRDIKVRRDYRSMDRYDIEVEGSHNYLADGVMVHNSPETTTGGRALKFYSSIRLDVRRIETLKDGTDMVGNRTRVKVVKNKCLAEGSMIFDPTTGMSHRIEEIVDGRLPVSVLAVAHDGSLRARPVVSWFDQGEQDVIGVKLDGGATVWATLDHKILTDRGWEMAGKIVPGDQVAQATRHAKLADQVRYATVKELLPARPARTFDIEVDELHNFVADNIVVHNCASPFKQAEFDIMYGKGISREGSLIDVGVEQSIIRKSGAWYTYDGDQLGQGKENSRNFLKENPDVAAEIEKKILEKLGVGVHAVDAAGGPELPPVDF